MTTEYDQIILGESLGISQEEFMLNFSSQYPGLHLYIALEVMEIMSKILFKSCKV